MFFSPELEMTFLWRERFYLRGGSVRPQNKKQISAGLRNMSPESIRNRFLASKRSFSDQELQYLTSLDGINHYAFGVEEVDKGNRGIGVVRLVRSSRDTTEAEVAITIIDDYQRLGLGSFLIDIIILAALERNIERLSFTLLPHNDSIIRLVSKIAPPIYGETTMDYVQIFLEIKNLNAEVIKSRLMKNLPEIDIFRTGI